ncbi:hypothetical protein E4V42_03795 [Clostridium estertheticum]|uniref:Uncharacterized protein n=1 Tax=Clostridium estertheticum TaxID=238834 RepID=A0A5N7IXM9_9CLOT|nr:hypothetical protein [Clostridium estertheticum]MPQ30559.1 hypothetical protein [Clostridium estertheticum]MPQ61235.1 hypothetical protein [Clostridium estertheticum]
MFPLGCYDRMVQEIKRREDKDIPVTFGILIADYRHQINREYILNYIERFNYRSDQYINFYLPGYLEGSRNCNNEKIIIDNKEYYFSANVYDEFLRKLEMDFYIDYPYIPVLLLLEYANGNFNMCNKIYIDLDSESLNIKKTGNMFDKIFSIAQKEVNLQEIKNDLMKEEFKSGLLDRIIKAIDNSFILEIYDIGKKMRKYKVI